MIEMKDATYTMKFLKECLYKFDKILKEKAEILGLTNGEAHALILLSENPELDSAYQIIHSGPPMSKSFVSKTITSLAGKGIIELTRDEKDKRIQHIKLTEKADEPLRVLFETKHNFIQYITSDITSTDRKYLKSSMEKVSKRLTEIGNDNKRG